MELDNKICELLNLLCVKKTDNIESLIKDELLALPRDKLQIVLGWIQKYRQEYQRNKDNIPATKEENEALGIVAPVFVKILYIIFGKDTEDKDAIFSRYCEETLFPYLINRF